MKIIKLESIETVLYFYLKYGRMFSLHPSPSTLLALQPFTYVLLVIAFYLFTDSVLLVVLPLSLIDHAFSITQVLHYSVSISFVLVEISRIDVLSRAVIKPPTFFHSISRATSIIKSALIVPGDCSCGVHHKGYTVSVSFDD